MAAVTVLLPGVPITSAHRKVTIRSVDGLLAMTVPYADPESDFSSLGQEWATIQRSPLVPVTSRRAPKLAQATLRMQMIAKDRDASIAHECMAVKALADSMSAVVISYGQLEAKMTRSGAWIVQDASVHILQRAEGSNDPRWASAELSLLEWGNFGEEHHLSPDWFVNTGQQRAVSSGSVRIPSTYTLQAGEDLVLVALKFYGDAGAWTRIGDLNGIRDPRAVQPGTVLRLPPP